MSFNLNNFQPIYKIVFARGSKTESAAHTITYDNVAVPGYDSAKRAFLDAYEVDISVPDVVASKYSTVDVAIMLNKHSPTSVDLANDDTIGTPQAISAGSSYATPPSYLGPNNKENLMLPIKDGYVTVAIVGDSNQTNTKGVHYFFKFILEI